MLQFPSVISKDDNIYLPVNEKNNLPFPTLKSDYKISPPSVVRQTSRFPSTATHGDDCIPPKSRNQRRKLWKNKTGDLQYPPETNQGKAVTPQKSQVNERWQLSCSQGNQRNQKMTVQATNEVHLGLQAFKIIHKKPE